MVLSELARGGYPWAPELILALMQRESGGIPGNTNETSGASGLMQVMPGTLRYYNDKTGSGIPLSMMRSTSESAAPIQIRVGLWVLGRYWRRAYQWLSGENQSQNIPLDELMKFGDAFYHAGPRGMQNLSRNLPRPVKWRDWKARHPNSRITIHADAVWANTVANNPTWNLEAVDSYVQRPIGDGQQIDPIIPVDPEPTQRQGFLVALIIIAVVSYFLKKK